MRILLATDGSPASDAAVHLAAIVGSVLPGQYSIVCVIARATQRDQAEATLKRAEKIIRGDQITVQKCIRIGAPAEQILQHAKGGGYDLLMIGNRSPHIGIALIARTVEKVISQMACPVLIARGEARPLKRVLVCEAGRDPPLISRMIRLLSPLLATFREITVLHVMSQIAAAPGVAGWELEAEADELIAKHTLEGVLLEKDLELLRPMNLEMHAKVRHGLVLGNILFEAKSRNYDLVVIGSHSHHGWEHYLLDDLTQAIVGHINRPVLIIPTESMRLP